MGADMPAPATAKTIDDYLARCPPKQRKALQALRKTIRAAAPDAEEVISYHIPGFKQDGYLVGFAAFTDHCSLFPGTSMLLFPETKPYRAGRGTLQFTPEKPIPAALVKKIVKRRLADNKARAAATKARRSK